MAPEHDDHDIGGPIVDGEVMGVVTPTITAYSKAPPYDPGYQPDAAAQEAERVASHATVTPTGIPYCYTNCDVTVTIDPMKNQMWTRDDSTYWKQRETEKRKELESAVPVHRTRLPMWGPIALNHRACALRRI